MKKLLPKGAVAATAVGALLLTSCGFGGSGDAGDDSGSGDGTTIDLLVPSYSSGTKARWEGIIEGFEAANEDIKVDLEVQSWDNIRSVVQTKIQGNQAPDILNIDAAIGDFVIDDLLYPANEVLSEDVFNDFTPSFAENAMIDGTQYAMPILASVRSMFYNKDLFEEAGVSEPPTTWDELLTAAQKIADLEAERTIGYGMPLGTEEAQAETAIFLYGNGGGYGTGSEITINTPKNVEAAEFMKTMIEAGVTEDNPGSVNRTSLMEVFIQGKIGMMIGLPQTIGKIEEKNPELNYGTSAIPTADGEPMTLGVADQLVAFKNDGSEKEATQKFLEYFYSPDVYTEWVGAEGFLPTTMSGTEVMSENEEIQAFLELLPNAVFYPATNPSWADAMAAIQTHIGKLGQGEEAAPLLEQIQQEVE